MINIATANIGLSIANIVTTELEYNATGDPEAFDGCFRLGSMLFAEATTDSSLDGAIPLENLAVFDGVFRPIVVRSSFLHYLLRSNSFLLLLRDALEVPPFSLSYLRARGLSTSIPLPNEPSSNDHY